MGGAAEWLLEPARPEELAEAVAATREQGLPLRVLGGGANLLVEDGLLPGVVIATDRMARVFRPRADEGPADGEPNGSAVPDERPFDPDRDPAQFVVWAGAGMPGLVRAARELGWSGLEGLAGVPGNVGGGIAMNAGGRWGELWDVVESVRLVTPDGELVDRARADCSPGYRDAHLGDAVVAGAVLALEKDERARVQERVREYLAHKSAAQPVTERSSGCIFKNPDPEASDGRSAGKLIEDCGGKGLSRGDAIVSAKHANFIVNRGKARAADVFALIEDVGRLVRERSGVELVREVRVWGAEAPFRG